MSENTQELDLKFSCPDVWDLGAWDVYSRGRLRYTAAQREAKLESNQVTADYYGSIELIRENIVHIVAPDEVKEKVKALLLDSTKKPPLALVGLVLNEIGYKLEAALNDPLELSLIAL